MDIVAPAPVGKLAGPARGSGAVVAAAAAGRDRDTAYRAPERDSPPLPAHRAGRRVGIAAGTADDTVVDSANRMVDTPAADIPDTLAPARWARLPHTADTGRTA